MGRTGHWESGDDMGMGGGGVRRGGKGEGTHYFHLQIRIKDLHY